MPSVLDELDTDEISDAEAEAANREAIEELADEVTGEGPSDVDDLQASRLCRVDLLFMHTLYHHFLYSFTAKSENLKRGRGQMQRQVCVPECAE